MKHLKTYQIFESNERNELNREQRKFLNERVSGTWVFNTSTGLVDVEGNVVFFSNDVEDFMGIKFGNVKGTFDCSFNNLKSLEGAPHEVGDRFYCNNNNLASLAGSPKKVGGRFDCDRNSLTSLAGAPKEVGGIFDCRYNNLISLEGAPEKIGGVFLCDEFEIRPEEWNIDCWLKMLESSHGEARKLVISLLSPEELNNKIARDPAAMVINLKSVWNDPEFKGIKSKLIWPRGYEKEMNLAGDMGNLGF